MSSCDIQTKNKVMSVLNKQEHKNTISKINDLVNQIPCDIRQNGGGMTNAQYAQLLALIMSIIVAINAVMEVKEIQSAQCDLPTMILNSLSQSQHCTNQSNALNNAITAAVAKVTGAAGLGVGTYLLSEDKKEIEDNKETKGGRRVRKSRKSRKSRKTKKSRKVKKSKKSRKVKKTKKSRKSRKA
jgi:hypothetical protein